jgi:hypothetical protein
MGKCPEEIATSENDGLGSCKANHVGIGPQEDCGGARGEVGEGTGGEEEIDGLETARPLICFGTPFS